LITHCHSDHTGGVKGLKEKINFKNVAHELEAPYLEQGDNKVTAANWYRRKIEPSEVEHEQKKSFPSKSKGTRKKHYFFSGAGVAGVGAAGAGLASVAFAAGAFCVAEAAGFLALAGSFFSPQPTTINSASMEIPKSKTNRFIKLLLKFFLKARESSHRAHFLKSLTGIFVISASLDLRNENWF
jgi:hypothetical protein